MRKITDMYGVWGLNGVSNPGKMEGNDGVSGCRGEYQV